MGRKERYSGPVAAKLADMGFGREFSESVASFTDTEYTSRRMLSYLNSSLSVTREEVADELLIILEDRDRFRQRHRERTGRGRQVNDLYIRSVSIDREVLERRGSYVLEIPALRAAGTLTFRKNLTFFCGENGSGKSTLLEALAVSSGLNPEGGTRNYAFSTYDDCSDLADALRVTRGPLRPEWSWFLRAESFFNVATAALKEYNGDGRMPDYHARSHGESFLDFITDTRGTGLYLMDEPEAALSPQRQLELLVWMVRMSRAGSQIIAATHSPILLGAPDAEIWSFDGPVHAVEYEETDSYRVTKLFLEGRDRLLRELLREDG